MENFIEKAAEGSQQRRRLPVSGLLEIENLTGERTPIIRLFEHWQNGLDLTSNSWIDVTPENPYHFILCNHSGRLVGGMSNFPVASYPFKMHAQACAAEYLACKTEARPVAHYVNQNLAGYHREYVRLMVPIVDVRGNVSKIVYAFRHILASLDIDGTPPVTVVRRPQSD